MFHREEDQPPHFDFAALDGLSALIAAISMLSLLMFLGCS